MAETYGNSPILLQDRDSTSSIGVDSLSMTTYDMLDRCWNTSANSFNFLADTNRQIKGYSKAKNAMENSRWHRSWLWPLGWSRSPCSFGSGSNSGPTSKWFTKAQHHHWAHPEKMWRLLSLGKTSRTYKTRFQCLFVCRVWMPWNI